MQEPMSIEGYDVLIEEFKFLLEVEKPKTAQEKLVAAALGDRSENADYQAAKEKLRHIDKRLFYLNAMIQKAHIIDPSTLLHTKVSFGSSVRILDLESDKEEVYTICGVLESEPENGLISIHSPLAQVMLGKRVSDEFKIQLPLMKKEYEILEIYYKNIFSLKKNVRKKSDFAFH
ncbi:GreA/GreB family elongation factor [Sulfurimonas denitrificans DSM 1251]|jgi:transcription elongation factor GreA|uniref:Transcription elongation factor GreA n=1 Tax=Sulfurimonas denitrificans (strain ATCC 33889 / DSM 1251) TaxID=326298 RepID=Q30T56_SULDN|nr:transcription elongation factor GreA [Sulfurimonas denitrificans]ABB43825.1 GreA/GreB family elongation factor [Sulfurimonas denitrificans DSM 1251]MDD3443057.1 transcription elongation factor GreA [Sulfurimonas denitrificans]